MLFGSEILEILVNNLKSHGFSLFKDFGKFLGIFSFDDNTVGSRHGQKSLKIILVRNFDFVFKGFSVSESQSSVVFVTNIGELNLSSESSSGLVINTFGFSVSSLMLEQEI